MLIAQNHNGDHSLEQILDRSHELRKQSERLKHQVSELAEKIARLQRRSSGQTRVDTAPAADRSDDGAPSTRV